MERKVGRSHARDRLCVASRIERRRFMYSKMHAPDAVQQHLLTVRVGRLPAAARMNLGRDAELARSASVQSAQPSPQTPYDDFLQAAVQPTRSLISPGLGATMYLSAV